MSDLHPCPRCFRHIRSGEAKCPFCAAKCAKKRPDRGRTAIATVTLVSAASVACVAHPDPGPREPRDPPRQTAPSSVPTPAESNSAQSQAPRVGTPDAGAPDAEDAPGTRMVAIYGESTTMFLQRLLFAEGSVRLPADHRVALDEIVKLVDQVPNNPSTDRPLLVEIEGHADSREKNAKWLAKRRAEVVRDALLKLGIPKEKLSVEAYAAERPLAPSDSSEHRQLNRRVTFKLGSQSRFP